MWFNGWSDLQRIIMIGLPIYVVLVALLRVTGTRTLSKMNAFDAVVTFALGSALATAVMTQGLPGATALAALLLLVGVQFVISWLAVRYHIVERLTKASPRLLLVRGEYLEDEMRRARIARGAILAAMRSQGHGSIDGIAAVILETDGSLSIVPSRSLGDASAFGDVDMPDHARSQLASSAAGTGAEIG